jgi:hypothetical protein
LIADPAFWYEAEGFATCSFIVWFSHLVSFLSLSFEDAELECKQEEGIYFSVVATIVYFVACCILCCAPSADPFCYNFGQSEEPKKRPPRQTQPTVIVQPIIIQEGSVNSKDSDGNPKSSHKRATPY